MQRAVILYGLPLTFTAEALRELLSRFGTVRLVRRSQPDHWSFIIGYGEMKHRDEAREAVKTLHGTMVGGYTLIVHRSMPLTSLAFPPNHLGHFAIRTSSPHTN